MQAKLEQPTRRQYGYAGTIMTDFIEKTPTDLAKAHLSIGAHASIEDGACPMELAGWFAGEKWSDCPQCVCPVIGTFVRTWNDALAGDERARLLLPIIPRLVGTRGSEKLEKCRAFMAADWLLRVNAPTWLALAGFTASAGALASGPEIASIKQISSLQESLQAIRQKVAAARTVAWAAEWDKWRDASRDTAWFDDWEAAWAGPYAACHVIAGHPVWETVRDAARDAAAVAMWSSEPKKIRWPKAELQQSAVVLLDRLIATADDNS